MTYAKFDDNFAEHPKIAGLSDAAFRVHVRGILYANRLLTDGLVPTSVAHPWSRRGVRELVAAGLWTEDPRGYLIHDYLDWNDSAEVVNGRRDSKRMAGAMGAAIRWGDSKSIAQGVGVGEALELGVQEPQPRNQASFADFWRLYPRKQGKIAAEKAYQAARKRTDHGTIMAALARFVADPNRDPEFTPFAQKWLNQGRWEDDPLPARSNGSTSELDRWMQEARRG